MNSPRVRWLALLGFAAARDVFRGTSSCPAELVVKGSARAPGRPPPQTFVVLKFGHTGSTWFSSLLADFDSTYYLDEAITDSRRPATKQGFETYVRAALAEPTGKYVLGGAPSCAYWQAQTPGSRRCHKEDTCALSALGLSMALGHGATPIPAWLNGAFPAVRLIVWIRSNVVKTARATQGDKGSVKSFSVEPKANKNGARVPKERQVKSGRWKTDDFAKSVNGRLRDVQGLLDVAARTQALVCYYEAMQLSRDEEMEKVRRFIGLPPNERPYASASTKASDEDLSRTVHNFGKLRDFVRSRNNTCLLEMLTSTVPRVFPVCEDIAA